MGFASPHQDSKDWTSHFHPSQIVCLEHEAICLYAEVVQIVEARHLCWARPLALMMGAKPTDSFDSIHPKSLHDLRQGSDLLLPAILFRPALDVEVMPLLSQLYGSPEVDAELSAKAAIVARQSLNQFVRQVWQAHPDVFSSKPT